MTEPTTARPGPWKLSDFLPAQSGFAAGEQVGPAPTTTPADVLREQLERAGVPVRFLDRSFDTFEARRGTKTALEAAQAVVGADSRGLVLIGPPGSGKTHLAVSIVRRRLERWLERYPTSYVKHTEPGGHEYVQTRPPHGIRFEVVPSLLDRIRRSIDASAADPLAPLVGARLLVLDDLGREKFTDWVAERLYVLVNERYNTELPTIATSNYTAQQLVERGYDALYSRLLEGGDVVQMTASDHRKEGR